MNQTRISVAQASQMLQMDEATIRFWIEKGKLPIGFFLKKPGKKRGMYVIYLDKVLEFMGRSNNV